ncbi:hypothetical protein ABVK25_010891 [Lepraria finkii]|uniref:dihydroorotase n=1 Tax=Lepraria finkii TaxID=1340010 RepID=A0ABR4AZA8_9LECA
MPSMFEGLQLPATFDAHVHLRSGEIMEKVVGTIRDGGADMVFVMPNLVPPITTVEMALEYQSKLQALEPNVTFLMSLFLCPALTPDVIIEAKKAGIKGVKSYPAGVTTNSATGVLDYKSFYPVIAEIQKQGLILNLHGECPSSSSDEITILNAEEAFLPTLGMLHRDFPDLKIVLEHCTTEKAIEAVKSYPTVVGTITAHHLSLTVDDWAGDSFNYCKPVAKTPRDRIALLKAAASGSPQFFFGSDSAPHSIQAKQGSLDPQAKQAAGVFTQPFCTQLVLDAFEQGCQEGLLNEDHLTHKVLSGFLGEHGRLFYGQPTSNKQIILGASQIVQIPDLIAVDNRAVAIAPFRRGQRTRSLGWL